MQTTRRLENVMKFIYQKAYLVIYVLEDIAYAAYTSTRQYTRFNPQAPRLIHITPTP